MPVALYLDVHIPRAIPLGLRVRQVDVLTAQGGQRGAALRPATARPGHHFGTSLIQL